MWTRDDYLYSIEELSTISNRNFFSLKSKNHPTSKNSCWRSTQDMNLIQKQTIYFQDLLWKFHITCQYQLYPWPTVYTKCYYTKICSKTQDSNLSGKIFHTQSLHIFQIVCIPADIFSVHWPELGIWVLTVKEETSEGYPRHSCLVITNYKRSERMGHRRQSLAGKKSRKTLDFITDRLAQYEEEQKHSLQW